MLNVRGMGLYQGFSLDTSERKNRLIEMALERHGLLLLGCGSRSIRLRPNLSVTQDDIDQLLVMLDECLTAVS